MSKNNNHNSGSFMSFSNDCPFLDELGDEKNLNLESIESQNFIEPFDIQMKTENKKIEFFSEISPIACNSRELNVNDRNEKKEKSSKDKHFLTADSQFSSLVNIGIKNHFSLDEKSHDARDKSVFTFTDKKSAQLASKGKNNLKKESAKSIENNDRESLNSKINGAKQNKKNKVEEHKDKAEKLRSESGNKNARQKTKKANDKQKDKDKDDNIKLYLDNIRKNKEQNIAKLAFQFDKEHANKSEKAKFESIKATCENTANIKSGIGVK